MKTKVETILNTAAQPIALIELKKMHGSLVNAMKAAGAFTVTESPSSGNRPMHVVTSRDKYLHPTNGEVDHLIEKVREVRREWANKPSPKPKSSESAAPQAQVSKAKITPEQLKKLIYKLRQTQDGFAESKKEVAIAEAMLQEQYERHEELSNKLGEIRDEVRRVLPRDEGNATFQFEDGSIFHVDFGVLSVVEIKPIRL